MSNLGRISCFRYGLSLLHVGVLKHFLHDVFFLFRSLDRDELAQYLVS